MTHSSPRITSRPGAPPRPAAVDGGKGKVNVVAPEELTRWIEERTQLLAQRWLRELDRRVEGNLEEARSLLEELCPLLVSCLPHLLGPYRSQVEALWQEAAEFYGNVGSMRGLAAGEAIEEFQLLREVLIRQLYEDPPGDGTQSLGFREVLRLNRIVDEGVTYAGVGHTDALFFALFQGTGVARSLTPDLHAEVTDQITAIRRELDRLTGYLEH